jgi:hypothetical protein
MQRRPAVNSTEPFPRKAPQIPQKNTALANQSGVGMEVAENASLPKTRQ